MRERDLEPHLAVNRGLSYKASSYAPDPGWTGEHPSLGSLRGIDA